MDEVYRKYLWIKLVLPKPGVLQFHGQDGGELLESRVVPHISGLVEDSLTLTAGVTPFHETTGPSDAVGFFVHGLPATFTEQEAREWIDKTENLPWREGADAWFMICSFARLTSN